MSSRTGEEDAELSAALGWPGGISEPLLDRAALLRMVGGLRAELASMRRRFEAADRERSELRARAERAEAERDALRAALEKDKSVTAPPIWETLAEIGESAPAGTWDALPAELGPTRR